ncbi:LysR substrate-binding domain-containing protein [Vibrio sp. McD22-P3]|uniref:LysR substrate-binding domain-containing protein n=1 Tax=Vibrio sp. McD22-P3 TaxID=2724880 RepID=UPI001F44C193|nr:LysR substrate-binding domain-containing protein [Vibrio sp. McD22-P3]MCF4173606.1 LysR substrate-binding domain-containing protein [Vibrio sp. McD22-P3]
MSSSSGLPSIKALKTFVAVAHNLSFSKAAQELCVTQGAVSKQVAALEQQLGQALFERHIDGIRLTSIGEQYLPSIIEALESVQSATARLKQSENNEAVLNLDVTPSFASLWLINALQDFRSQNASIRINLKTGDGPIKGLNARSDIIIRCLPIATHYENATLLHIETLRLVGSTDLIERHPIRSHQDLEVHQFIPHITRPQLWEKFRNQFCPDTPMNFYGVGFEHFFMSLEAVKANCGLALLPDFMVDPLIEAKQLSNPLALSLVSQYGYYAITPNHRRDNKLVYLFNQWLEEQFRC